MLSRITTFPRRSGARVLGWINDNPLTTAGVTMAAVAGGYLLFLIQGASEPGTEILSARPAYLLAILVGVASLVWEE